MSKDKPLFSDGCCITNKNQPRMRFVIKTKDYVDGFVGKCILIGEYGPVDVVSDCECERKRERKILECKCDLLDCEGGHKKSKS